MTTPAGAAPEPLVPPIVTPESRRDPFPLYRLLRDRAPVHWEEQTSCWYVSRYADVAELLLEPRLGAPDYPDWIHHLPPDERDAVVPVEDHLARWPVFSDRPAQGLMRQLLQPALTRAAVQPLAGEIRSVAQSLADRLPDGPADLLADFARPAALWTVTRLLGLSALDDGPRLERWSDLLIDYVGHSGLDVDVARAARPAVEELTEFVRTELLANPSTAVAVQLARAADDPRIELQDVVAMVAQLVTGGVEPTATATCVAALRADGFERPADEDGPASEDRLASEVEAALAADPPFQLAAREVKEEFVYQGKTFAKGQRVKLLLASAGQDERGRRQGSCPMGAGRGEPARHLAFSRGRHFCLGAPLARLHLQAVLDTLVAAGVPERIDRAAVQRGEHFGLASFLAVPLRARTGQG